MGMLQQIHGKNLNVARLLALPALAALAIAGISQTSHAALVASDNAGSYTSWTNSSNGGSGFGTWGLSTMGSNAGFFVGSSTANDNGNTLPAGDTGDIDTNSEAWGMYANSSSLATATRNFTGCALAVGQSFSLAFDNGNISFGSSDTFSLLNSSGNALFQFGFAGGTSDYFYTDSTSTAASTGVGFTYFGLNTLFTLTSNTTYSLTITPINPSLAAKTIFGTISGSITGFQAVNDNAGNGSTNNFYINSAAVSAAPGNAVPLPASLGFVLAGGLGLAAMALSRRRSGMQA